MRRPWLSPNTTFDRTAGSHSLAAAGPTHSMQPTRYARG